METVNKEKFMQTMSELWDIAESQAKKETVSPQEVGKKIDKFINALAGMSAVSNFVVKGAVISADSVKDENQTKEQDGIKKTTAGLYGGTFYFTSGNKELADFFDTVLEQFS